ncbi:MAG: WYL domain-containing protein [Oscillospiraceae bacterium]|nr:WYL domain-containing protein [Oscillospiraceae bacterium]
MPASPNQRAKLLYLRKILLERTDEQTPMSMPEIISALATYDVHAERKSIYTDLEILRQYGLDIEVTKGRIPRYYIGHRHFELPELKLLVDAVQSSRFITEKKSEELISKVAAFTSHPQSAALKRQIFVTGRPKSFNEQSFYSVDKIHEAINTGMKITFKYYDYNVKKKLAPRKNGALYEVTPVTLCWDSDKYYLVAYNAENKELRNYRVDRMGSVELSEHKADFDRSKFNITRYAKQTFGMFSGEVVRATLAFDNSLVNVVLDYFGMDAKIIPKDNGRFEVSVDVAVSPVFLGWMFQFGDKAKIVSPDSLVGSMRELIKSNTAMYD